MSVRIIVTEDSRADCTEAAELTAGINVENFITDKAYNTNQNVNEAESLNIKVVTPSKTNRKIKREIDEYLYELRHIKENTFLEFKRWRSIATRYCKIWKPFLSELQLKATLM